MANVATSTWILAWEQIRKELMRRCSALRTMPRLLRVMPFSYSYALQVQNYYNHRRSVNLPFSTPDWLQMEIWGEAGIHVCAIQDGIAEMFDRRDRAPEPQHVNSLAYCHQAVLNAARSGKEASVGSHDDNYDIFGQLRAPRYYTLLLALPPGRPMFEALQSERQVHAVAESFNVGLVFTIAPDEYRKHQARERFGVELEFLDLDFIGPVTPLPGSRLAGPSRSARSRQSFLNQEAHG